MTTRAVRLSSRSAVPGDRSVSICVPKLAARMRKLPSPEIGAAERWPSHQLSSGASMASQADGARPSSCTLPSIQRDSGRRASKLQVVVSPIATSTRFCSGSSTVVPAASSEEESLESDVTRSHQLPGGSPSMR